MHKKFEINRTKIKGGCQSGRKVVTHNFKSALPLINISRSSFQKTKTKFKCSFSMAPSHSSANHGTVCKPTNIAADLFPRSDSSTPRSTMARHSTERWCRTPYIILWKRTKLCGVSIVRNVVGCRLLCSPTKQRAREK